MERIWQRIGHAIVRRGRLVAAAVIAITLVMAGGLSRLEFETSQASLIEPTSDVYQTNLHYQDRFGG